MHNTMTLAQVMADTTSGNAYLWIDAAKRFAKIVHRGVTVARIDRLTDGTARTTSNGVQTIHASWEIASQWLQAQAIASLLVTDNSLVILA